MPTEKITIVLPVKVLKFVDQYRKEHSFKTRSQVIEHALAELQEEEVESDYLEEAEDETPDSEGIVTNRFDEETK